MNRTTDWRVTKWVYFLASTLQRLPMLTEFDLLLKRLNFPTRFRSALLDHLAMLLILLILSVPLVIFVVHETSTQNMRPVFDDNIWYNLYTSILIAIYFNKDIVFGRSIGKRITGLQVIDLRTGSPPVPIKSLLRNLTMILWPLEVVVLLFTRNRRIGDFIASTEIRKYQAGPPELIPLTQCTITIVLSLVLFFALVRIT